MTKVNVLFLFILSLILANQNIFAAPRNPLIPAQTIVCQGEVDPGSENLPNEFNSSIYITLERVFVNSSQPLPPTTLFNLVNARFKNGTRVTLHGVKTKFTVSTKVHSEAERRQFYDIGIFGKPITILSSGLSVDRFHFTIQTGNGANLNQATGYMVLGADLPGNDYRAFYNLTCSLNR